MVLLWSLDINSTILDSKYIYNVGYFAKVLARALRSFAIQVIFFILLHDNTDRYMYMTYDDVQ